MRTMSDLLPFLQAESLPKLESTESMETVLDVPRSAVPSTMQNAKFIVEGSSLPNTLVKLPKNNYSIESDSEDDIPLRARKRTRTEHQSGQTEPLLIGHHVNEPTLPVYAKLDKAGHFQCVANRKDFPEYADERWSLLQSTDGRIWIEDVLLDKNIFRSYPGDIETIESRMKSDIIEEYLEATKMGRPMNLESFTPPVQLVQTPPGNIHVGYSKDYSVVRIPVYAYMLQKITKAALTFQILKSDTNKGQGMVSYEKIDFKDEFYKGSKEATRSYIKSLLIEKSQVEEAKNPRCSKPAQQFPTIILGQEDKGLKTGEMKFGVHEMQGLQKQLQKRISKNAQGLEKADAVIQELRTNFSELATIHTDTLINVEAKNKEQDNAIKERDRKIADLEVIIRELRGQLTVPYTTPSATVPPGFQINQDHFGIFPAGNENAGMLFERVPRQISHDGKKYEERVVLAECKIHVAGSPTGEEVIMEGIIYTKYAEDGVVKLIQKKGSSSLVEFQGRSFFKLITRKEVEQEMSFAI